MKKLLAAILALAMILSLCACTDNKEPNGGEPVDIEEEHENDTSNDAEPVSIPADAIHFEIPARGEKSGIDITADYSEYGRLYDAKAVSGGVIVVGVLSDTEVIIDDVALTHQLYLLDLVTKEAKPLLHDEVYGHTYDEYYESVTKKWTLLEWCANPTLNSTRNGTEKPMIAYYSNKYAEDGVMTNEENCWDVGAIWILDIDTGEETRIPAPDGSEIMGGAGFEWHGDKEIILELSTDGKDQYACCNVITGEYTISELDYDDICAFIDIDREFYKFCQFNIDGLDMSDSLRGANGTYYRVTDERFNTPEKLETFLHTNYVDEHISNYIDNWVFARDGKVYRAETGREYDVNGGYRVEATMVSDDQIRVMVYSLIQTDPDFNLCTEYGFLKEDGGWKIGWAVRNRHTIDGWENTDDLSGVPLTADEIVALIEQDAEIWSRLHTETFAISEPGVPFDETDPANYVEKVINDWTYYYYKVINPNFDTWEKWETYVGKTYTGDELEITLNDLTYTDIDGALYGQGGGGLGYYDDKNHYVWHVTDYTEDSVTVLKRYGDFLENCETIIKVEIVMVKTPDGWRISSVF